MLLSQCRHEPACLYPALLVLHQHWGHSWRRPCQASCLLIPSAKSYWIAPLLRPCWEQVQIIAVQKNTSLLGSLSNTLRACSTLPHLEYILTKAFPKEVSDSNVALKTRAWISVPSFRTVGMHKHAGLINMTMSCSTLFCICWNSSKTCLLHSCWWWLSNRLHLVQVVCPKFGVHLPYYHWWLQFLPGYLSLSRHL